MYFNRPCNVFTLYLHSVGIVVNRKVEKCGMATKNVSQRKGCLKRVIRREDRLGLSESTTYNAKKSCLVWTEGEQFRANLDGAFSCF